MNVKKFSRMATIAMFLAVTIPASSAVVNPPVSQSIDGSGTVDARIAVMLDRLHEIKDMDKSNMTGTEKKALRKEVKGLRKEMKSLDSKVYISIGAIIIIVLLLILLL